MTVILDGTATRHPTSPVHDGIVAAIGATPMVRLDRLFRTVSASVLAKVERANPGGSTKDRPAREMVEAALAEGRAVPGVTTIVESSSGNLGVALALVCAYHRLGLHVVTDPKASHTNLAIMRALGARVEIVTERDHATGEFLPTRLLRVQELLTSIPGALCLDQYNNPSGAAAHRRTAREIVDAIGEPDVLFVAAGSCGSLRGIADHLRSSGAHTRIVAVDACGSAIFGSVAPPAPDYGRTLPGHGSTMVPGHFRDDLADDVVFVTDAECVAACRLLAEREAILAGGSSGAVIAAIAAYLPRLPAGSTVVTILPDGGDRYLHSIYDDAWVQNHIGLPAVLAASTRLEELLRR
ncbi:2,3-diaminopropionate biosynthesis protein SbnA [Rhodococcus sp. 15-649-2-2]|uniref:2,3-diaminopropionate biosynthesis protein SbnA n=1 Tax=Rhodococcus sp. 15-649-2-2 TaxID=2023140 RepID=UPI000B9A9839|nr:2,3-diaminopropionate biosynthesis protein SbnA [Rhodococcus sp. 15-649-2-2]OZE82665.1 2,3-diaminopropionate biosynthesis protein SbnA [Rhodococcus sp. 15-649-2-2]